MYLVVSVCLSVLPSVSLTAERMALGATAPFTGVPGVLTQNYYMQGFRG